MKSLRAYRGRSNASKTSHPKYQLAPRSWHSCGDASDECALLSSACSHELCARSASGAESECARFPNHKRVWFPPGPERGVNVLLVEDVD